jgi:hypothetical protein
MIKKGLLVSVLVVFSFAQECQIDYKMMWSIAQNEKHKNRDTGYPYLISFNKKQQRFLLRKEHRQLLLDNRTLDCKSKELCVEIADYLIKMGVRNMDLGAFQVCYMYHGDNMPLDKFFDLNESYKFAYSFVKRLVNQHGCTWQALARYHSATPTHNSRYAKGLKNVYYSY